MIEQKYGNILDVDAELLINASNGKGWMGGLLGKFVLLKGVAETIHYADSNIEGLAKKEVAKRAIKLGDVFLTDSGKLPYSNGILHAVTMLKPGRLSNIKVVEKCVDNILNYCEENKIKTVAIPLLGTGTGRVNANEVLRLYENKLAASKTLFNVVTYKNPN